MPKFLRRGLVIVAVLCAGGLLGWRMLALAQFTPGPAAWAPAASGTVPLGWNPAHYNSACAALSGTNNVVATGSGAGVDCLVYAVNGQTTGRWYGELDVTGTVTGETAIGLGNTASPITTTGGYLGYDTSTLGLDHGGAVFNNAGPITGSGPVFAAGNSLCVALDLTSATQKIWFANLTAGTGWEAGPTDNPATGVGGFPLTGTGVVTSPVVLATDVNPSAAATIVSNLPCSGDPVYGYGSAFLVGFSPFPGLTNNLTAETWNPNRVAPANPNTFSGDLLTVTAGAGGNGERNTFGIPRFLSGKYKWQVTVTFAGVNTNTGVGVANGAESAVGNQFIGQAGNNSIGYYADGNVFVNNVNPTGSPIATYASGASICVAVNYGTGLIWFQPIGSGQWNNAAIGSQSPDGNVGGFSISAITSSGTVAISPATVLYTAGDTAVGLFSGTPCSGVTGATTFTTIP